jgi:glutamine synthetase
LDSKVTITSHQLQQWLQHLEISEIECLIPDMTGLARGKIVPARKFDGSEGLRLPEAVLTQTVTGDFPEEDYTSEADPDMRLIPDPATARVLPWAKEPSALVIHDCVTFDGKPAELAPRNVLKHVMNLFADKGWQAVVAPEMEFYFVETNPDEDIPLRPPLGRTGRTEAGRQGYSIDAVDEFDAIFDLIYDWCEQQNLAIDTLIHEMGTAQMEINFDHGCPLSLADQVFVFKRTVRQAAIHHNMYATFMAKPIQGQPGSAMHIHQSLEDGDGRNVFSKADGSPSNEFFHFIGGLQTYLPAAMPFLAPFVNSYRRLSRYTSAPINLAWGYDNRTCGLRVPHSSPAARRVENRLPGVDVNPYLAIAASLACGYLGIEEKIQPSEPYVGSAYGLPRTLPRHLDDALDQLRQCEPLKRVFGARFVDTFCGIKEAECREFDQVISAWERRYLLQHV